MDTGFGFDPEAVIQDADIEMAEFEAQAAENAALRRRGICTHGSGLGGGAAVNRSRAEIEEDRRGGRFPDRETDVRITCQNDIKQGTMLCLDCGQIIDDPFAGR